MWQLQELKARAARYFVLLAQAEPRMGRAAGDALVSKAIGKTLGAAINHMMKAQLLDDRLGPRFTSLLQQRNWLVHRSRADSRDAIHSDDAMQTLMRRLEFVADESAALMNEAAVRVQRFAAERGLSTQKIDRATHQLLQQWQNAVAEFERDFIVERTQAGLARAKADGKTFGRKPKLDARQQAEVLKRLDAGETLYRVAQTFGVARQVIMRVRDKQGPI